MQLDFLSDVKAIDPDNDNIDINVTLVSGRQYALVVATPNNIY